MFVDLRARCAQRRLQRHAPLVQTGALERVPAGHGADSRAACQRHRAEQRQPLTPHFAAFSRAIRQEIETVEHGGAHCITSRKASPNAAAKRGECRCAA